MEAKIIIHFLDSAHILKSLSYFIDAEEEPMPKILKKVNWKEVKKELIREVKKIVR